MRKEIANPLQALIAGAAKTLPADTGETARLKARLMGAVAMVVLADVSSSMEEKAGSRRKIDILAEALAGAWPDLPGAVLIAFGSTPRQVPGPEALPAPSGGTALHLALDEAGQHRPSKTLVISDGRPDDEGLALEAAGRLSGIIDVLYCGPDSDRQALDFMYRLARLGGGRVVVRDVRRDATPRLAGDVRALLGLPAPTSRGRDAGQS